MYIAWHLSTRNIQPSTDNEWAQLIHLEQNNSKIAGARDSNSSKWTNQKYLNNTITPLGY